MKKLTVFLLVVCLLASFLMPVVYASSGSETYGVINGQIYYICNTSNKKAWDVSSGNTANGSDVAQYEKTIGALWQQWQIRYVNNGEYVIADMHSGKLLRNMSDDLKIYDDINDDSQKFQIISNSDGTFTFLSKSSNYQKAITCNGSGNGDTLLLQNYVGSSAQKFRLTLEETDGIKAGEHYGLINVQTDKAITVPDGNINNGTYLYEQDYLALNPWQKWRIVYEGNGDYIIIDVHSGNLLSIAGSSASAGERAWMFYNDGTSGQRFRLKHNTDDTFTLLSKCSNYTLAVTVNSDGSVCQNTLTGTNNQKFHLGISGVYNIKNLNSQMSLDVSSANTANGSDVAQYTPTFGSLWQQWYISYAGDGNHRITDMNSGKLLSIAGSSAEDRANVHIWEADGTNGQLFRIKYQPSGGYTFYSKCSGYSKAIGVLDSGTATGQTFVQLWADNSNNQKFELIKLRDDPVESGLYFFQCSNTARYMESDSTDAFAEQWNYSGEDDQIWEIEYQSGGYYRIKNFANSKYLTVQASTTNKVRVNLESALSGTDAKRQRWKINILINGKWELQTEYHSGSALVLAVGQPTLGIENGVNIEQRNDDTRDEWRLCRTMNTAWIGQEPSWCWVTCAKMMAESYGYQGTQYPSISDAVVHVKGSAVHDGGDDRETQKACDFLTQNQINFSYVTNNRIYSEGMLRIFLDDGNPIILGYNDKARENGHSIVVYGYYYDGETCRFLVRDPGIGPDPKENESSEETELREEKNRPKIYDELLIYANGGINTYWTGAISRRTEYYYHTCENMLY